MFYDKYLRLQRDLFDPCGVLKDVKPIGGLHSVSQGHAVDLSSPSCSNSS